MANLMLHFSQRFPTFYVATHVLLSGCSGAFVAGLSYTFAFKYVFTAAGGLSALIHAHRVASFFSGTTVFKVLVDGGLFFDDVIDHRHIHPHITDTLANYRGALGRTPPADGLTYRHQ